MGNSSGRASNWLFNTVIILLFVGSVLYMGLYFWPHSQGRASPLDKYAPAGRSILQRMGLAPKTVTETDPRTGKAVRPVSGRLIRHEILQSAEWINSDELDSVQTSGRTATVLVRARMTNDEALAATLEIFKIVFPRVDNVASLRVLMRVKARTAAGSGRIEDLLRSDITMTRATYNRLNWSKVTPNGLPKVADRAKLYF